MQRYFINEDLKDKQQCMMTSDDLHHIKKVMRQKNGDSIICIDTFGVNYHCHIEDIDTGVIAIDTSFVNDSELDIDVTLVYALPKGDKFELVLQKATELGVTRIVPLLTNRCVVKMDKERFVKKKPRFLKIVKEASEQSYRNHIPSIEDMITLKEISSYIDQYAVVAYEETAKQGKHGNFYHVLSKLKSKDKLTIIVGSEGGFDPEEIELLETMGIVSCSLGKRILRSETAPLYMLSVIGYSREVAK